MKPYNHDVVEKKWRNYWSKKNIYKTKEDAKKKKFYILDMFPYPSGEGLHVGHPKGYIATDVYSRYMRMRGFNVLHPMGFDAFGLPAENYAIKNKTNPAVAVTKNVQRYKDQLEILGFDYDWSREVNTTDPKYYKWTQWIFLQLFNKGLVYESFEPINWCPSCKTGLANEDIEDGKCERCGTVIEKKPLKQLVIRITDYADKLLEGIDEKDKEGKPLINWPESIKSLQRNWIGKSEGAEIDFEIKGSSEKIKVFTTRPDTLFGVTYVVVAPEYKSIANLIKSSSNSAEINKYIESAKSKTEIDRTDAKKEKTGVEIKGVKVINPVNKVEVPVFVADYVLGDYGTGAVMAVPGHDERDWDFAKKYNLPIKSVIEPLIIKEDGTDSVKPGLEYVERRAAVCIIKHWSEDKYLMSFYKKNGWKGFIVGGLENSETADMAGAREIEEETGYKSAKFIKNVGVVHSKFFHQVKNVNRYAHFEVAYFELQNGERIETSEEEKALHDVVWLSHKEVTEAVNREDIRMAWKFFNGESCYIGSGIIANSGKFDGKNSETIAKEITAFAGGKWVSKYRLKEWVFSRQRYWGEPIPLIHCEKCGIVGVPEKDLPVKLPKVVSYEPTGTGESPLAAIDRWVNTKCPKCKGKAKRETNTMPQWAGSSWYYLRYMDNKNSKNLVSKKNEKYWAPVDLYVGGAEHATRHLIYARFWHRFLYDHGFVSTKEPFKKLQHVGLIMAEDGRKMSKRWGNVVNPDDIVKTYGADTLRVYEMFMGPFDQAIAWNTNSMVGSRRFVERVWKLFNSEKIILKTTKLNKAQKENSEIPVSLHKAVKKVTEDIADMKYNTAISTLMIALNELESLAEINRSTAEAFIKLFAPFAPHVSDEIWVSVLKNKKSIHLSNWPEFDESKIGESKIVMSVQVNGKVRDTIELDKNIKEAEVRELVLNLPNTKKWLEGKEIKKFIYIPGRVISIVTN